MPVGICAFPYPMSEPDQQDDDFTTFEAVAPAPAPSMIESPAQELTVRLADAAGLPPSTAARQMPCNYSVQRAPVADVMGGAGAGIPTYLNGSFFHAVFTTTVKQLRDIPTPGLGGVLGVDFSDGSAAVGRLGSGDGVAAARGRKLH